MEPVLVADALGYVRQNADRAFFLYLTYTIPHSKLQVLDLGTYSDETWPQDLKKLAAMITRMHRDVGVLMAELEKLKLDEKSPTMAELIGRAGAGGTIQ